MPPYARELTAGPEVDPKLPQKVDAPEIWPLLTEAQLEAGLDVMDMHPGWSGEGLAVTSQEQRTLVSDIYTAMIRAQPYDDNAFLRTAMIGASDGFRSIAAGLRKGSGVSYQQIVERIEALSAYCMEFGTADSAAAYSMRLHGILQLRIEALEKEKAAILAHIAAFHKAVHGEARQETEFKL